MILNGVELYNVAETDPAMLRLPKRLFPALPPLGVGAAQNATGVELRFVPEGEVKLTLSTVGTSHPIVALLYYGSTQSGGNTLEYYIDKEPKTFTFTPAPHLSELPTDTPFSPQVLRLMPAGGDIVLHKVEGKVRPPRADEVPQKTLLFYGSSITHGSLACAPNMFWTRRTAEALGFDHRNFGIAGSCRMEPEVVDFLSKEVKWDAAVPESGINMLGDDPALYRERLRHMLETLHAAQPEKYLFCIDLYYCASDLRGDGRAQRFRDIHTEEVARIASDKVVKLSGLDLLPDRTFLSEDLVHPSVEGVITIAERLTAKLREYTI